jgi:hypothetical protein
MSSIYEEHKDEDGFLYITYVPCTLRVIETYANKAAATRARIRSVRRFEGLTPILLLRYHAARAFRIHGFLILLYNTTHG